MEQILLKQQKELEEFRMEVGNVYQAKNDIQRQADQSHAHMDINLQKQMAFNEKLQKLLEETKRVKPFNYDNVFIQNSEFKKQNILLQVTQGIVNGGKRCRYVVGCSIGYCSKRYWKGLQKV